MIKRKKNLIMRSLKNICQWLKKRKKPTKSIRKNNQCAKCGTDCLENGSYITEGGKLYYFCRLCTLILDDLPQGKKVRVFLYGDDKINIKCDIRRAMVHARMKRSASQGPWRKDVGI